MQRWLRRSARAGLAVCASVALVAPLDLRGEPASRSISQFYRLAAANPADEGLLFTETPMTILTDHSHGGQPGWMRLQTDPCGTLQQVQNSLSIFRPSALDDDSFDGEDEDPADAGREIIGKWLSQHADVAVINEGIDKTCDRDWFGDQDLSPEFDGSLRNEFVRPWTQQSMAMA